MKIQQRGSTKPNTGHLKDLKKKQPLAKIIKKKREKAQINRIRNEKGTKTTEAIHIF